MKLFISDMLMLTAFAALAVGSTGCMVEEGGSGIGGSVKEGDVYYYAPGPEFERSQNDAAARATDLPNSSAPASKPLKP